MYIRNSRTKCASLGCLLTNRGEERHGPRYLLTDERTYVCDRPTCRYVAIGQSVTASGIFIQTDGEKNRPGPKYLLTDKRTKCDGPRYVLTNRREEYDRPSYLLTGSRAKCDGFRCLLTYRRAKCDGPKSSASLTDRKTSPWVSNRWSCQ